jgi:SH3 domain-containing YSC84-like protein 1
MMLFRVKEKSMKKLLLFVLVAVLTGISGLLTSGSLRADDKSKDVDRLESAGDVVKEILDIPDDIPQTLLDKADCVIVLPSVLKGAFIVGGSYGRGAMTCRSGDDFQGPWGAPSMMALGGGSLGFQLGGQATDFVLLVMNQEGARAILNSQVKLGGDASAVAGPVGRDAGAATDVTLRAEVLTYSRSRGLFAGISLEGSSLRPDNDANDRIYGKKLGAKDIVLHGAVPPPPSARKMIDTLTQHSPKNLSK